MTEDALDRELDVYIETVPRPERVTCGCKQCAHDPLGYMSHEIRSMRRFLAFNGLVNGRRRARNRSLIAGGRI